MNGVLQPLIASAAFAGGYTGQTLSYTLAATYAGSGSLTPSGNWTFAASGLPPGLSLSSSTSSYGAVTITGTPTTAGTYAATVSATVPASTYYPPRSAATTTAVVTFVVKAGPAGVPTFGISAAFDEAAVLTTFDQSANASNNPSSYAASGLPPGLTLNASTPSAPYINGTPTAAGRYPVVLSATNAAGTSSVIWTVVVTDGTDLQLQFTGPTANIAGTVGSGIYVTSTQVIASSYGSTVYPRVTYTCSGLPPGVTTWVAGAGNLILDGAPTAAGNYPVTLTATSSAGISTSEVILIEVAPSTPIVSSAASIAGSTGSPLAYNLSSYSTVTSYAASGLPPGLSLNTATGAITGTPTAVGTYPTTITLTTAAGTGSAVVTFVIAGPAFGGLPIITSAATTACQDIYSTTRVYYGNPTQAFGYTITALNTPTSFGATNLPVGLSLNPYTGVISGQPTANGIFQVPIPATNTAGTCTATLTIIGTVTFPTLLAPLAASGSVGTPFSIEALIPAIRSYGLSYYELYQKPYDPVTFAAVGLPPGLSMDAATGYITGTPSQAGTYPISLTATNRAGTSSGVMTTIITATTPAPTAPPVFYGQAMAAGVVGSPLSYALAATNTPSYTTIGLPAGLSLNAATGLITGTPQAAGTFAVPVTATNTLGTVQGTLTMIIAAGPTAPFVSSAAEANATLGTPFVYAVYAGNYAGMPTATSYGAGVLPTGLQFDPKTGFISGTPTGATGTYQIPISASTGGSTGTATLTLVVQAAAAATGPFALSTAAGTLGFVDNPFIYYLGSAFHPDSALPSNTSSGTG